MNILRASNGNTSSAGAFWLMAAIRIKDRSGPGMTTVSTGGAAGVPASAEAVSGDLDEEAARTVLRKEKTGTHKRTAAQMANVRSGNFIVGYLLGTFEPRDRYNKVCNGLNPRGTSAVVEQGLQIQHSQNLAMLILFTGPYFRLTVSEHSNQEDISAFIICLNESTVLPCREDLLENLLKKK